ncbi:MAG: hypothetical protein CMJ78_22245 [Planctomycetaceae bacterium]|nr:hypothetical protein [Planctomycetaceae bacterium]
MTDVVNQDSSPAVADSDSTHSDSPLQTSKKPEVDGSLDQKAVSWFTALTPLMLVLYFLSSGPMYWHWYESQNMGGSRFVNLLYRPLSIACEIPFVGDIVDNYVQWWIHS